MPIGEALGEVASKLGAGRAEVIGTLFGRWTDIVGSGMAAHVRPVRIEGDTLVVQADHPAWATQVRHLATDILDRVRDACGESEAPRRIEVRVRA
jgi:predicted nucleic acid-binding Zn ribbon protein